MSKKCAAVPLTCLASAVLYPCLFVYFQNAGEASLRDIIPVTGALMTLSAVWMALCWLCVRDMARAALAATAGTFLFLNFALIEKALLLLSDRIYYWHGVLVCLFLWVLLLLLIWRVLTEEQVRLVNQVALLIFLALIVMNGVLAAPRIVNKVVQLNNQHVDSYTTNATGAENRPNIYYFIFDEYGGTENLKRYCNYDNTPFYEKLRALGFQVSEESFNESTATVTVIPNLLNLDYVNFGGETDDADSNAIQKENLKNPYLYQLLFEQGYQLNTLDKNSFLDDSASTYRYVPGTQSVEGTAAYYILQRTALYPFYRDNGSDDIQELMNMVEYAKKSAKLQSSNLFTMAYFGYPHTPWFVDAQGNPISGADRVNYVNTNIYLGQLQYGNQLILEIVGEIIESDPESVIIIQSDHGFRWPNAGLKKFDDWETEDYYMRNILNCVYFQGKELDIEKKSGINTLRLVLNELFDTDMPLIDPGSYDRLAGES